MNGEKLIQIISIGFLLYMYWKWTRRMVTDPEYPNKIAKQTSSMLHDLVKIFYFVFAFIMTIVAVQSNNLESLWFFGLLYIPFTWLIWIRKRNK
ncbi:MAG: hypothetical protein M3Q44_00770 [bacterium]|nr:hypothetical protein [bacterium]